MTRLEGEQSIYKGGTVPQRATEADLPNPDSLIASAMQTSVNPIAAADTRRRITFARLPENTGGVTGFLQ